MMLDGFFCQVLLGVLAKFRSPPNPLIAGDEPTAGAAGSSPAVSSFACSPSPKGSALRALPIALVEQEWATTPFASRTMLYPILLTAGVRNQRRES